MCHVTPPKGGGCNNRGKMKMRVEDRLECFVVKNMVAGLLALVAVVVRVGSPRAAAPAPLTEHVKAIYLGDKDR